MFNLTPSAAEQILRAAAAQQEDAEPPGLTSLRVAAKVEDGEIVYGMGFDEEREQDAVIESCGVTLLISPRSQELLAGATLDFVELHPGEFQFIFNNPNDPPQGGGCASRSSGCGGCGGGSTGTSGGCS
ncbi:MAG: iron-sulfur cluster biosynthesis family protein [Pseudomonadota bacterium]|jgi:iron-sulfur cluster assembly protein